MHLMNWFDYPLNLLLMKTLHFLEEFSRDNAIPWQGVMSGNIDQATIIAIGKRHDHMVFLEQTKTRDDILPGIKTIPRQIEMLNLFRCQSGNAIFFQQRHQFGPVDCRRRRNRHFADGYLRYSVHITVTPPFQDKFPPRHIDPRLLADLPAFLTDGRIPVGHGAKNIETQRLNLMRTNINPNPVAVYYLYACASIEKKSAAQVLFKPLSGHSASNMPPSPAILAKPGVY